METACLVAHEATKNLGEFLTTKSDCIDLKNEYIKEEVDSETLRDSKPADRVPESVKLLDSYMTVLGVSND